MILSIKNYIINYFYKINTKVDVDEEFYNDLIFLNDLEDNYDEELC